jgi:hypothetical protein
VSKHQIERPRHSGEIECLHEQAGVSDLPAAAAAHETPKLLLGRPSLPRRLLLEGAKGSKVTLSVSDPFYGGGTESADQLVLQVCDAGVETPPFQLVAPEVGAEAGSLETPPDVVLLRSVVEARQRDVEPLRPEHTEDPAQGLRTSDRNDGDALGEEIPTAPFGERLERALVADPFDEDDRTHVDAADGHA